MFVIFSLPQMNIAYVTTYNALDIQNWSGLGYMIADALKKENHELNFIGNLRAKPGPEIYLKKAYYKLINKDFDFGRHPSSARQYARQITAKLNSDTDIIFSPGSIPVSLLQVNKPKVIYTDATFAGMVGFYKYLSNLSEESIRYGHFLERSALESCSLAIYSSDWAAQTAIEYYGVDPGKVKVVPFGSNMEDVNSYENMKDMISQRSRSECHLLFLAVDWARKGGDMAIKIATELQAMGVKATLHIVGINELPPSAQLPFVKSYGYVSKNDQKGKKLIEHLLSESHFLLLPTTADCTPVAFSEANSFGLPCITTNVGGISTIIKNGMNGQMFDLKENEMAYAEYIAGVFCKPDLYTELALSSFNEYQTRLNWRVAGRSISKLLMEIY